LRSIDNAANVRLLGFERVTLKPGESRTVTLNVDPRLLAMYDAKAHRWRIKAASYEIALSSSASAPVTSRRITLGSKLFAD
jgi:beta-glucosidase